MTNKTRTNYAPVLRERAKPMVLDHERDHDASRWAVVVSIADKIGCAARSH